MQPVSLLILSEVEAPRVKLVLPVLRQGDRVKLRFKLDRVRNGRAEVLDVQGEYRVTSVVWAGLVAEVSVESTGKAPAWRAVKKKAASVRKLGPTHFPPTTVT